MSTRVDNTAIIYENVDLADDVEIGPYCVIGPNVEIGAGTRLISHVTILGKTTIGTGNTIFPNAVLGAPAQDIKSMNTAKETELIIGNNNVIRESVTINKGTPYGGGKTIIGNDCYLMACSHVGHDCELGSSITMANCVLTSGHTKIEDYAYVSGQVAVHQFVTIGTYGFISGASRVPQDAPPFMITQGPGPEVRCVNTVGLKRRGFVQETIEALREAHRIIWRLSLPRPDAIEKIKNKSGRVKEVKYLVDFLERSSQGKNGRARESLRGKYEFEEDQF